MSIMHSRLLRGLLVLATPAFVVACSAGSAGSAGPAGSGTGDGGDGGAGLGAGPSGAAAVQIVTGVQGGCARLQAGGVECWGYNSDGELGNGTAGEPSRPVVVTGITNAKQLSTANFVTCAVLADGSVSCWGQSGSGVTIGVGAVPVVVPGLAGVEQVAVGSDYACARQSDSRVSCWGKMSASKPSIIAGLTGVVDVALGNRDACAVTTSGDLQCWNASDETPKPKGVPKAARVSLGSDGHGCVVLTDATVACWGRNADGQLGDGTAIDHDAPVAVTGLSDVLGVSAGEANTCAWTKSGAALCWGDNHDGSLGNGSLVSTGHPSPVTGLATGVVELSNGSGSACARTIAGAIQCWGDDGSGQLGDAAGGDSKSMVPVPVGL